MPLISRTILEALSIASLLAVIDLFVSLIFFFINPSILVLATAGSYLILEFGVMLILGACLMSRSPLDDDKRLDDSGNPVPAWKWALRGKMILLSSVFALLFGLAFAFIDSLS
ncbi:MAG: hypothetical protein ACW98Y_03725 [Candidatus Thorarchaeota archaeon]|jgi:hypothetical protein